jgi:hypothetical protein
VQESSRTAILSANRLFLPTNLRPDQMPVRSKMYVSALKSVRRHSFCCFVFVSVLELAEWVAGSNNDPSRGAEVWMVDIIERREEAFLDSLFGPAHVLAATRPP